MHFRATLWEVNSRLSFGINAQTKAAVYQAALFLSIFTIITHNLEYRHVTLVALLTSNITTGQNKLLILGILRGVVLERRSHAFPPHHTRGNTTDGRTSSFVAQSPPGARAITVMQQMPPAA